MSKKVISSYTSADINDLSDNNLLGIRQSPTTVIGEMGPKGQVLVAREVIDNSGDEHMATNATIPIRVWINTYKGGYEIRVMDAGRGMPLDMLEKLCTKLYVSGKQGGKGYALATAGTYGIGLTATTAASKTFCCITKRPEGTAKLLISEGAILESYIDSKVIEPISGTYTLLQADPKIFDDCDTFIDGEGEARLMEYIKFLSAVSPNSLQIEVYKTNGKRTIAKNLEGDIHKTISSFNIPTNATLLFKTNPEDTMKEYVQDYYNIRPEDTIFDITEVEKPYDSKSKLGFSISFVVAKNLRAPSKIMSAVNRVFMRMQTSDHITVFYDVVKEMLYDYIVDEEMAGYFKLHYKLPIYPSILINLLQVKYVGAAKEGFKDNKFRNPYRVFILEAFKNIEDKWEELYEILKDDIKTKYHSFSKTIVRHKGLDNVFEHLNKPNNYKGCRSKDNRLTELFLTEGNSAGDALKSARDSTTQALYYLMGKTVNAIKKKQYEKDAIYQDLKQLIGVESHDTNLDNMSFSKILILADADIDGLHIATLILSIFYKINPLIISSGRVAICNPPLYSFSAGNKTLFMKDENARKDTLIESAYEPVLDISIETNGEIKNITGEAYRDLCYMVMEVGTRIERVAKTMTIDPSIIELFAPIVDALKPSNVNIEVIAKHFNLPVSYNKIDKAIILDLEDGSELTIPTNNLYKQLKNEICPILNAVNSSYFQILITTKLTKMYKDTPVTFVYLLKLFQILDKQATISRFKGIGVLNPDQIGYTCVDPATRSIINIYDIGDVEKIHDFLDEDPAVRKAVIENVRSKF